MLKRQSTIYQKTTDDPAFDYDVEKRKFKKIKVVQTKNCNLRQFKVKKQSDSLDAKQEQKDIGLITSKINKPEIHGFFGKTIPMDLVLDPSKIDIGKSDARINTKPSIDQAQQVLEVGDSLLVFHRISVAQTCYNEIIEKLKDQSGILVINGKMTSAGESFSKACSNGSLRLFTKP